MTDKQKQAIKVLCDLWHNKTIDNDNYFLLLECILEDKPQITYLPSYPFPSERVPTLHCCEPNGICPNPFRDCINCPYQNSGVGTWTSAGIDISEK